MEIRGRNTKKMHEFQIVVLAGVFFFSPSSYVFFISFFLLYTKLNFLNDDKWNYWQRKPQQVVLLNENRNSKKIAAAAAALKKMKKTQHIARKTHILLS